MDVTAWGAKHMDKHHKLLEGGVLELKGLNDDGSVQTVVKVDRPFGVQGAYYVRMAFTASEIGELYRQSVAGSVKGLVTSKK
jgi:hypothetical protein